MSRVLIVEDDAAMTVALRDGLTYDGHTVMVAPHTDVVVEVKVVVVGETD